MEPLPIFRCTWSERQKSFYDFIFEERAYNVLQQTFIVYSSQGVKLQRRHHLAPNYARRVTFREYFAMPSFPV